MEEADKDWMIRMVGGWTVMCSLGCGLHTLTAVPRLTQPSTLRGTVKRVSAVGGWAILINGDGGRGW